MNPTGEMFMIWLVSAIYVVVLTYLFMNKKEVKKNGN